MVKVTAASRRVLLLLHFAGLLVPTLLVINLVYATLLLFIPIMGRTGTASYPDLFIGCLTVSTVVVLSTWQVTVKQSVSVRSLIKIESNCCASFCYTYNLSVSYFHYGLLRSICCSVWWTTIILTLCFYCESWTMRNVQWSQLSVSVCLCVCRSPYSHTTAWTLM